MVPFLEALDLCPDCSDSSRPVRAEHIRESRFGAKHFGKFAFALVGIPDAHAGGLDAEKDFIRPRFGHREFFDVNVFDAAETVEGGGTHC